ncbi:MAG: diguanylate cyclase [Pseudomonadales bacterium]|nr:diguanylate cyclase [Pseudomonadales bacterium]
MKVLVAEDTRSIRMIVGATVTEAGHQVVEACNGDEAIRLYKEMNDIDLILMDAEMPGIDGFEATRAIRDYSEDDWVPIVFLSAHNEDDYVQRALDTGADVYLQKPINSVQLLGQIRAMERIAAMKARLSEINHELQQVNSVLESMAKIDGLTQVSNRRSFDERIEIELARCKRNQSPLSIILCDIDCFKQYNDTYGHLAGDNCLKKVAKAIERNFGRATDLVARYGGEEFVVLLPDTPVEDAFKKAESMLTAVTDLKIPHRKSVAHDFVSISLGVACMYGEKDTSRTDLISKADEALYQAKENGRNQAQLGLIGIKGYE